MEPRQKNLIVIKRRHNPGPEAKYEWQIYRAGSKSQYPDVQGRAYTRKRAQKKAMKYVRIDVDVRFT